MRKVLLILTMVLLVLAVVGCAARPPDPPPPGMSEVEHAIEYHFGFYGPEVVEQAKRVAWCESRWNNWATNGQFLGVFQLGHWHYWRFEGWEWSDPYVNARAAAGLWLEQGWRPWECKP